MSTKHRDRHAIDRSDHAARHAEHERESAEAERARRLIEEMDQADRARMDARRMSGDRGGDQTQDRSEARATHTPIFVQCQIFVQRQKMDR
jgi:hypothetical protein